MFDSRFETPVTDIDHLLAVVDIDQIEDLDTTLMILLDRPIEIRLELDDDGDDIGVEVVVFGDHGAQGVVLEYPVTVLDLTRAAAENERDLGPYTQGRDPHAISGLDTASDADLIHALKSALGSVRMINMLEGRD